MLQLGTLLALACALATNVALLCKHRGAVAAPRVELRRPIAAVLARLLEPVYAQPCPPGEGAGWLIEAAPA